MEKLEPERVNSPGDGPLARHTNTTQRPEEIRFLEGDGTRTPSDAGFLSAGDKYQKRSERIQNGAFLKTSSFIDRNPTAAAAMSSLSNHANNLQQLFAELTNAN